MKDGTIVRSPEWEDRVAEIVDQYESQWRELIEQITPPDAVSFVSSIELPPERDPEQATRLRDELRQALASVDRDYRRRILERAKPETRNAALDETVDRFAPLPDGPEDQPHKSIDDVSNPTATFAPERKNDGGGETRAHQPVIGPTRSFGGDETDRTRKRKSRHRRDPAPELPEIPGYTIESILGRGGMGIVYRARQDGLNRTVALKMILDKRQADEAALTRFQAEAEAVAKLDHENIVKIYEIGTTDGLPYFSLEFVEGRSLDDEWNAEPLEPGRCVEIVETLARAMDRAHAAGIVHRDLKPANVLVRNDGVLKVTDFGLVKRIEEDSGQTQAGTVMGTPSFMAPEQARGETDVGPSADVYALGAVLYALLTGRPPFQGPNAVETLMQLRNDEPLPPSRLQPKIPRDLETICLKAIQKDPARRYGSAEELADDLHRFQTGEPIHARPAGLPERVWRWCLRKPVAALALLLGFCLMVGSLTAALVINSERNIADAARELAETNEAKAKANEIAATKAQQKAHSNAVLAGKQRGLALTALNTIVERVPKQLKNTPGTETFKRTLLLTAMNGLNLVADTGNNEDRDIVIARAHAKMGEGLLAIGQAKHAHKQFERSHAILVHLKKTDTDTRQTRHLLRLGRSHRNLAYAIERLRGVQAAEEYHRRSLDARRQALKGPKDRAEANEVKQEIAEALGDLARVVMAQGRHKEAQRYVEESLKLREDRLKSTSKDAKGLFQKAGGLFSLGHSSNGFGQHQKAMEYYLRALAVLDPLRGRSVAGRANWALGHSYVARTFLYKDDPKSARAKFQVAVDLFDPMVTKAPRNAQFKRKLAQALYGIGVAESRLGREREARAAFERCWKIRQALADGAPSDIGFQQALMFPLARLGKVESAAAIADSLRKTFPNDAGNWYFVACCYALCAEARRKVPVVAPRPGSKSPSGTKTKSRRTARQFELMAIASLRRAVANGYRLSRTTLVDPDLAPLRGIAEFQKLVGKQ